MNFGEFKRNFAPSERKHSDKSGNDASKIGGGKVSSAEPWGSRGPSIDDPTIHFEMEFPEAEKERPPPRQGGEEKSWSKIADSDDEEEPARSGTKSEAALKVSSAKPSRVLLPENTTELRERLGAANDEQLLQVLSPYLVRLVNLTDGERPIGLTERSWKKLHSKANTGVGAAIMGELKGLVNAHTEEEREIVQENLARIVSARQRQRCTLA